MEKTRGVAKVSKARGGAESAGRRWRASGRDQEAGLLAGRSVPALSSQGDCIGTARGGGTALCCVREG